MLWVGMWLVLDGDFTLGQLIAFRIISGNVTGPLLQLSSSTRASRQCSSRWSGWATSWIRIQSWVT